MAGPIKRNTKNYGKKTKDFETTTDYDGTKTVMKKGSKYMDDADYKERYLAKLGAEDKRTGKDKKNVFSDPKETKDFSRNSISRDLKLYSEKGSKRSYDEMAYIISGRGNTSGKTNSMGRQDRPVVKQKKGDAPFFKHTTKGK